MKKLAQLFILLLYPTVLFSMAGDPGIEISEAGSGASSEFGAVTINTSSQKSFVVRNLKDQIFSISPAYAVPALPFHYKGGSYPGTGGTCTTTIGGFAECILVVEFSPITVGDFFSVVSLNYSQGGASKTAFRSVTGSGVNCWDKKFGDHGIVRLSPTDPSYVIDTVASSAVDSEGKLIIGVRQKNTSHQLFPALFRLNCDGSQDNFSGSPTLTPDWPGNVNLLPLGNQMVVSQAFSFIRKLNPTGWDSTYVKQMSTPNWGVSGFSYGAGKQTLSPDGILYSFGGGGPAGSGTVHPLLVANKLSDGKLDLGFNGTGFVLPTILSSTERAYPDFTGPPAITPSGSIVIGNAVFAAGANTTTHYFLAQYLKNGSPDPSFNGGNFVLRSLSPTGVGSHFKIAVQPDGKIVAVTGGGHAVLLRHHSNGAVDTSFGTNGIVIRSGNAIIPRKILVQPDSKILLLVSEYPTHSGPGEPFVYRFLPSGDLDSSFNGGRTMVDVGLYDWPVDMSLLPNGKIVIVGNSCTQQSPCADNFFAARLTSDGQLDQ